VPLLAAAAGDAECGWARPRRAVPAAALARALRAADAATAAAAAAASSDAAPADGAAPGGGGGGDDGGGPAWTFDDAWRAAVPLLDSPAYPSVVVTPALGEAGGVALTSTVARRPWACAAAWAVAAAWRWVAAAGAAGAIWGGVAAPAVVHWRRWRWVAA